MQKLSEIRKKAQGAQQNPTKRMKLNNLENEYSELLRQSLPISLLNILFAQNKNVEDDRSLEEMSNDLQQIFAGKGASRSARKVYKYIKVQFGLNGLYALWRKNCRTWKDVALLYENYGRNMIKLIRALELK